MSRSFCSAEKKEPAAKKVTVTPGGDRCAHDNYDAESGEAEARITHGAPLE